MRCIALTLAICSLTLCHAGSSSSSSSSSSSTDTYVFHVERDFQPYDYLDEQGETQGFLVELLNAVCKEANKRCATSIGAGSDCWQTSSGAQLPGVALMAGHVDGCLGWTHTVARAQSFSIIGQAVKPAEGIIIKKSGSSSAQSAVANEFDGASIAFQAGWVASPDWFKTTYPESTIDAYFGSELANVLALVNNGTADLAFLLGTHGVPSGFEAVSVNGEDRHVLSAGGVGLMVHKRNARRIGKWFEPALKKVVRSQHYEFMCTKEYNGQKADCFDNWNEMRQFNRYY